MITKEDAIEIAQDYISQEEKKSNYNTMTIKNDKIFTQVVSIHHRKKIKQS